MEARKKHTGGNPDKLKPFTAETARAAGRKGGIASGKARRERHTLREIALALRDAPCKGTPSQTEGAAMVAAMFAQAQQGNVSAFKAVAELMGETEQPKAVVVVPQIIDDVPADETVDGNGVLADILPKGGCR